VTTERWYTKWEGPYLGTGDERKNFETWHDDQRKQGKIDPDDSETDLLNNYRDTQAWTDSFLDWAYVMEADEVQISECERKGNIK